MGIFVLPKADCPVFFTILLNCDRGTEHICRPLPCAGSIDLIQKGALSPKRKLIVSMKEQANCEYCSHYVYDAACECYFCEQTLDEDEMARFMQGSFSDCPYFHFDDEYQLVRKQN